MNTGKTISNFAKEKAPKLTRKQSAFVKHIIDNPKASATEAAKESYNTNNSVTAGAIAYENLKKPQIIMALNNHNELIENTIINTINRYKDSDKLQEVQEATTNARWVHDKIHGKAKQQLDIQSTSVKIN